MTKLLVRRSLVSSAALAGVCWMAAPAAAHISVASGPGFADTTQEVSFGVGHGCAGADTLSVRVVIPADVTSVRAVPSNLGPAKVEKDAAGLVTAVTWSKAAADIVDGDPNYYKLTLRMKVPNKPFTTLLFPTIQTCRTPAGVESKAEWVGGTALAPTVDAGAPDAGEEGPEPAPALAIVPARKPGWNKYTAAAAVSDLATYFGDAQIVWAGTAAFSPNPTTAAQITTEPSTQPLTSIPAGATVWVKY